MESTTSAATDDGRDVAGVSHRPGPDVHPGIAALRAQGAHRIDPVRFRYLEALARRTAVLDGEPQRVLASKLSQLLVVAAQQADTLRTEWDQTVPALVQRYPHVADDLRRLHADGDVGALVRLAAQLESEPRSGLLSELLRHIERQVGAPAQAAPGRSSATGGVSDGTPADLKTVQRDKDGWARLRVDLQMARSYEKAPDKPGPLNSHLLVLRSMRRMQDIAPAYLAQFMSYVETLLWLDQAGSSGAVPIAVKGARPTAERKKPGRGRAVRPSS